MGRSHKDDQSKRVCGASNSDSERLDPSEEKRRAARRRFLLGGASALPVIITVTAARGAIDLMSGPCVASIVTRFGPDAPPFPQNFFGTLPCGEGQFE